MPSTSTWSSPRLLCIAGNFTRYDEHAVQQINRNIELLRYRHYQEGFLVLELVNSTTSTDDLSEPANSPPGKAAVKAEHRSVSQRYADAPEELKSLYEALEAFLLALGDDVTKKSLKFYFAFRRIKNFACVEVHPQAKKLLVYVKVDPTTTDIIPGFTRDVTNIGHFGTGDLEVTMESPDDLERAKPLLLTSYEES